MVSKASGTILFIISAAASNCVYPDQIISVLDDTGTGVLSNISISLGNSAKPLGPTDDDGMMPLSERCTRGELINASPVDPNYYRGARYCQPDSDSLPVKVTRKAFAMNLEENAKRYEATGQWGNAALAYNELAVRLSFADTDKAGQVRNKVYENFARAIETPQGIAVTAYDPSNKSNVMTGKFRDLLMKIQKNMGIAVTGQLDFQTLDSVADTHVMQMMTEGQDNQ